MQAPGERSSREPHPTQITPVTCVSAAHRGGVDRFRSRPPLRARRVATYPSTRDQERPKTEGMSVTNGDRRNGVPNTITSIPLTDPHVLPAEPSIGDLVKEATTQVSTLVRAEVELARAEITRDVKRGLTGSVYFIAALVVLFYSTFFFFFFVAALLDI